MKKRLIAIWKILISKAYWVVYKKKNGELMVLQSKMTVMDAEAIGNHAIYKAVETARMEDAVNEARQLVTKN